VHEGVAVGVMLTDKVGDNVGVADGEMVNVIDGVVDGDAV
jgi:hypothetical protein